jgi:SAM-dependent methyltransferase
LPVGRTVDPKEIVERGYDRIGEGYRTWSGATGSAIRGWFLAEVLARVPAGTDLLELGCGPGVDAMALARGRRYTGVDLSGRMLGSARRRVPEGTFVKADLVSLDLPAASFDAVVALYVFGHVPGIEHELAIRGVFDRLRPGGIFCASFPTGEDAGVVDDFIGVPMFFGGIGISATRDLLRRTGFRLELDEVREEEEPDGPVSFLWVIARRPAG